MKAESMKPEVVGGDTRGVGVLHPWQGDGI